MPRYEFECPVCGRVFDVVRPRSAAGDPADCPEDGNAAHRLFRVAGVTGVRVGRGRKRGPTPDDADATAEAAAAADARADAAGVPRAPGHGDD